MQRPSFLCFADQRRGEEVGSVLLVHTCGTVPAHGIAELAQPEPGYVIVGMKSYGRAPTFLLATGYQQGRSGGAPPAPARGAAARPPCGRLAPSRSARWWPPWPATGPAPPGVTRGHRPRLCAPATGTCWP